MEVDQVITFKRFIGLFDCFGRLHFSLLYLLVNVLHPGQAYVGHTGGAAVLGYYHLGLGLEVVKGLVLRASIGAVINSLHPVEGVLIVHCPMLLGDVLVHLSLLELLHSVVDLAADVQYTVLYEQIQLVGVLMIDPVN